MCELLADIVRDRAAPASARASAGRTVLEELRDQHDPRDRKPASELTVQELDEEIAKAEKA